jgi:outer membrane protein assembly factor BamB
MYLRHLLQAVAKFSFRQYPQKSSIFIHAIFFMKLLPHLLKRKLPVVAAIVLLSVSCKKHSEGPFVAPQALPASDIGLNYFVADWTKIGPAASYNLYIASDTGFTQLLAGYNPASVKDLKQTVTGLSTTSQYFYRLQAVNSAGAVTAYSNTMAVTTADTMDDHYVYIGSGDENFYCLLALTGTKAWSFSTRGDIESTPTMVGGSIYIGSSDQRMYSLDPFSGTMKWNALAQGAVLSSPACSNGAVFFASYAGYVIRADTTTGHEDWNVELNGSKQLLFSSPTVVNGLLYVGGQDHNLYALDPATGTRVWAAPTDDTINSSPAVSNGVVYVGCSDWHMYAFNAATGALIWRNSTGDSILSSPTVVNGVVYVGSFDNGVYAFDALNGNRLWRAPTNGRVQSSPAVANGVVYAGSFDNHVYAFDAQTGAQIWSTATGDRVLSSPVVGNTAVYVGSCDHNVYALDIKTGAILWTTATGDEIRMASPLVYTYQGNILRAGVSGDQQ